MTKYAAYDEYSIYAIGDTAEAAIAKARDDAREPEAEFETAKITDEFAAWIEENGWDPHRCGFDLQDGFVVDVTRELDRCQ